MKQSNSPVTHLSTTPFYGIPDPQPLNVPSVALTPDGGFVLSDCFNHRIIILNSDGEYVSSFGHKGPEPGQFWYPRGIALTHENEMIVCDSWNHRIQRFSLDGSFLGSFGSIGNGQDEFYEPISVIAGNDGELWILDKCNHRVKRCSADGKTLDIFGTARTISDEQSMFDPILFFYKQAGHVPAGLQYPVSFDKLDDTTFVIADTNNRRLCRISDSGQVLHTLNLDVEGDPPYEYPSLVTSLGNGYVLAGGLNSLFYIINLDRPWSKTEIDLNIGEIKIGVSPAVLVTGKNNDKINLLIIGDRIARAEVDCSLLDSDSPAEIPAIEEGSAVPSRWSEIDGNNWRLYLKSAPRDETFIKSGSSFIAAGVSTAKIIATRLSNNEVEISRLALQYYELSELQRSEGRRPKDIEDTKNNLSSTRLSFATAHKERARLRWMLLREVARLCELFNDPYVKDKLSYERTEFIELIKSELNEREDDYRKLIKWMRKNFASLETAFSLASSQSLFAARFLCDHIRYTQDALSALGGADHFVSLELQDLIVELRSHTDKLFTADHSLFTVHPFLELLGMVCERLQLYTSGSHFYELAGRAIGADKAIVAYKIKSMRTPKINLKQGQTIKDVFSAYSDSPVKSDFAYIRSFRIYHPVSGEPIQPWHVLRLSDSQLLVSDQLTHELLFVDQRHGDSQCRIVSKGPIYITGMAQSPSGEILLVDRGAPVSSEKGCVLRLLDIETGELTDLTPRIQCDFPRLAFAAHYRQNGDLVVYDHLNSQCWIVGSDFTSSEMIVETPARCNVTYLAGDSLFASNTNTGVYSIDLSGKTCVNLDITTRAAYGVMADGKGALYVANYNGLQLFEGESDPLLHIHSLENDGELFKLDFKSYFYRCDNFSGGNMLMADAFNRAFHLIKV